MPDAPKDPVAKFIAETESIRLANWSIRTMWKISALLVALTARIFASIFIVIARIFQRRRLRW